MQRISCKVPLHYHTSDMTCRSCGFTVDHELLSDSKCASRGLLESHLLEECEKRRAFVYSVRSELWRTVHDNFNPNNEYRLLLSIPIVCHLLQV